MSFNKVNVIFTLLNVILLSVFAVFAADCSSLSADIVVKSVILLSVNLVSVIMQGVILQSVIHLIVIAPTLTTSI